MRVLTGCLAALLALHPLVADAQGLSLEAALRAADRRNERPRIAARVVEQARAARRQAYGLLLPVASLSGTYRRRARETVREIGGSTVVLQRHDALSAAARVDVPLLDPTAFPRIAAAGHGVDAAEADADATRLGLWLDVAEAFFTAIASQRVAAAAERRIELAELAARSARARLEAGLVGRNVATRADLELAEARVEATRAQNAVDLSKLSLGYLIASDVPDRLDAPDGPIVAHLPESALVRRALSLRPDVRALTSRVALADALEDEPWLEHVPRVDANGVATWTNESGFSGNETDWTIAVTATWVAYDGVRYGRAAERRARREELALELDALRRQVRLAIRTALVGLASEAQALEQARARAEVAESNRAEVQARFDAGLVDALTLADSTQETFDAEADVARQELALRLAELSLMRAIGEWPGGTR